MKYMAYHLFHLLIEFEKKPISHRIRNILQSISINYILVGSVCVQRNFFKANCVEASFIRSLDSNLSSRSCIRWTSIGSRNSSVGRALDWRSKGPWFDPGFRQKLRRLPLHFFTALSFSLHAILYTYLPKSKRILGMLSWHRYLLI